MIGLLDYVSGYETSLSLLYVIPVFLAGWSMGLAPGVFFALICAGTMALANWLAGQTYSTPWLLYWNTAMRLGIFTIVAVLAAALRRQLELAHHLSLVDALTGAWNRRALYQALTAELARAARSGQSFSLVYLDIDDFKAVNDRLGHEAGDRVLQAVAETCTHTLRASDLTARLGGDEFALLLPDTDVGALGEMLPRLQTALQQGIRLQSVTFSMGGLTCQQPPSCVNTTLQLADTLMYRVKRGGKNAIHYAVYPEVSALPGKLHEHA